MYKKENRLQDVFLCVKMSWAMTQLSTFPSSKSLNVLMEYLNFLGVCGSKLKQEGQERSNLSLKEARKFFNDSLMKRDKAKTKSFKFPCRLWPCLLFQCHFNPLLLSAWINPPLLVRVSGKKITNFLLCQLPSLSFDFFHNIFLI